MLDRILVQPRVTERVTVEKHEHRAPTDESVRLLTEMEQAAQKRVRDTVRLESNAFQAIVQVEDSPMDRDHVCRCLFYLNGSRHEVLTRSSFGESADVAMMKLRDAVAAEIASQVMEEFVAAAGRIAFGRR